METMHAAGRRTLPPVPRPSADRVDATADVATEVVTTGPVATLTLEQPATPPAAAAPELPADVADVANPDLDETGRFVLIEDSGDGQTDGPDTTHDQTPDETPVAQSEHTSPADDAEVETDIEAETETEAEVEVEVEVNIEAETETETETCIDPLDVDEDDPAQQFVARLRSAAIDFADAAGAENAVVREAVPPARHRRARCRVVLRYADGTDADLTFLGPVERAGRAARRAFDADIARWLGSDRREDSAWLVEDADAPGGFAVDVSAWAIAG